MSYVLVFQELSTEYEYCATCLIIQKSAWLDKNKDALKEPVKERVVLYGSLDDNLPCEFSVCVGPSTILAGPNSVCMTHLLNNNPMAPLGKTLQVGSAGDLRIRHGRNS